MTAHIQVSVVSWDLGVDQHLDDCVIDPLEFERVYLHLQLKLSGEEGANMYTLPILSARARESANVFVYRAFVVYEPFEIRDLVARITRFFGDVAFSSAEEANLCLDTLFNYEFDVGLGARMVSELNKIIRG